MENFNFGQIEPKQNFFSKLKNKFKNKPLKTTISVMFELTYFFVMVVGIVVCIKWCFS